MSTHWFSHIKRRTPVWVVGALAVTTWMLASPATAVAGVDDVDDTCQNRYDGQSANTDGFSVSTDFSEATADAASETPTSTPCEFSNYDSPSYNVCFVANPRPLSTMPKWLARYQAQETASLVVQSMVSEHSPNSVGHSSRSLSWVDDVIDELRRMEPPDEPGTVCVDRSYSEECHNLPSGVITVTAGSIPPANQTRQKLELPWTPDDDEQMQRPLVDLRVGPSTGHSSPPYRPPAEYVSKAR